MLEQPQRPLSVHAAFRQLAEAEIGLAQFRLPAGAPRRPAGAVTPRAGTVAERERLEQKRDRFSIGAASKGLLAGPLQGVDRPVRLAGSAPLIGEQRIDRGRVREKGLFIPGGDTPVELSLQGARHGL